MRRCRLALLGALLSAFPFGAAEAQVRASATGPPLAPDKALSQFIHEQWGPEEGLPQSTVRALAQSSDGYLWMGTQEGLARFDGVRMVVFDQRNTPAFEGGHDVQAIHAGPDGGLWVGTRNSGLVRYRDGAFERVPGAPPTVSAIASGAGGLWAGGGEDGLFAVTADTAVVVAGSDRLPPVTALARTADGLLVGTEDGLYRLADGQQLAPLATEALPAPFVQALAPDLNGGAWIGTPAGLARLTDDEIQPVAEGVDWSSGVRALHADAGGTLWVGLGYGGGLGRLRGDRLELLHAETADAARVLSIVTDHEGSLWFGTETGGLHRLREGKFTAYTTREGLPENTIYGLYEDPHGTIWAGTDGGGLVRLRGSDIRTFTEADGLGNDIVMSVSGDSAGVWAGTMGGGLHRIEGGRVAARYTTADGLPSDFVFALYTAPDGTLWVGTDEGLARFERGPGADAPFVSWTAADGLAGDAVTTIYQDRSGALWVGSFDGGVSRFQDGVIERFGVESGLPSPTVIDAFEDAEGALWVSAYQGGLARFDGARFQAFTAHHGLPDESLFEVLTDVAGDRWMTSNRGIFRVPAGQLEALAAGRRDTLTSTTFGAADGLPSREMNGGFQPAGWRGRDGRLWFPSVAGLAVVDPARMRSNAQAPPVVIETVRTGREAFSLEGADLLEPVRVPAGRERIEFHYTALSFIHPSEMAFEYKLEGYNSTWQAGGPGRVATYTNLQPGTYTFRVRARNADGFWNHTGASATIYVQPHVYQTTWFLLLCAVAALGLAAGGYQLRVRHLRARQRALEAVVEARTRDLREEKERTELAKAVIEEQAERLKDLDRFKTRFFANVSHEFRTPLTMIVSPLEHALHGGYGTLDAPLERQLGIMHRNALRLLRLINQLLDVQKLEAGKMELRARPRDAVAFLEGVAYSCHPAAEQKGIDLHVEAALAQVELYFEPDKLEKVFYNLLSNAIKFTPAGGQITLAIDAEPPAGERPEGTLVVGVRDTGPGIPAAELPHIFERFRQVDGSNTRQHEGTGIGLSLVHELVLLHGGTVSVESAIGEGTAFTVRLPLGRSHLSDDQMLTDADDGAPDVAPHHGGMAELAANLGLDTAPRGDGRASTDAVAVTPTTAPDDAPCVLVVDDNADVCAYVAATLGGSYRVAQAGDGVEGLEKARALRPDIVISDVMMPRMDGNELCRRIKEDERLATTPVLLLTAKASHEMKMSGLEVRADDYMTKPFNAQELRMRVRNLVDLHEQRRALQELNERLEEKVQEQLALILREREVYEQQLLQAKNKAEASERLKSSILANVSHEFRTPLTIILTAAEIVATEAPEALADIVRDMHQNSQRLLRMVDAVLGLSRLESRNVGLGPRPMVLAEAVERIVGAHREDARERGLRLRFRADTQAPTMLDPEALQIVLGHLLDNAIKFTPDGHVDVTVDAPNGHFRIRVADTGIGISEAFRPHAFEAFAQESDGDTRTHEGIGLGLTVVQRLVGLMGGTVGITARSGGGSVFTLQFPAVSPKMPAPTRDDAPIGVAG